MPFLSDAPSGRSTVSILDVEETSVGSEIWLLDMVFLRSTPVGRGPACGIAGCEKAAATGVLVPESGGVATNEGAAVCTNGEATGVDRELAAGV